MERIAFVTYETPYAPCGGIAAVMGRLPPYVQRETNLPTVVITPMHHRIKKTRELTPHLERVGAATIHYENSPITVNILRLKEDVSWYFLLPDDPRFFAGKRHPYDVGQGGESAGAPLLRDALLFGSATAKTLHLLAPGDQWTVFMQDWEAATTALALTQQQAEHRLMLTFHNSYDCKADDLELLAFHINPEFCPGESVLTRCLPLVADPLTTVSGQFALDMTEELLQTKVLAPHLQEPLGRRQLLGVNNGPFVDLAVPEDVLQAAREGALDPLRQWKTGRRVDFHQALMEVRDAVRAGTVLPWETEEQPWGDLDDFLDGFDPEDDAPWFVMGGRDDSRQKGYDVAARAARDLLDQNADARFLFFPMPGDEGLEGLRFLKDLAEQQRFRKFMLVFPVRFYKGYMAALQGGTFGLMPSLYEPFGAANEFYLNGTVGIGRATGGIVQQIVPLRTCDSFSLSVARRSNRWHDGSAPPTGILFREVDNLPSAAEDWKGINEAAYAKGAENRDRMLQRGRFPVFEAMTQALQLALADGVRVFQKDNDLYYRMVAAGIDHIQQGFSWEVAARQYAHYAEIQGADGP